MELFKAAKEAMSMRSKINDMDKKLKATVLDYEFDGIKVKINAKTEFLAIDLPEDLLKEKKEKIEKTLLNAIQKAAEKSQKVMAEEAKAITAGMKIPGM